MRLVLIPLRRIDFDHVKLPILSVPVKDPLHARPPTPLHAPPARPRAPHTTLGNPRDVDVRPIDARIAPPRTPSLFSLHHDGGTGGTATRAVRRQQSAALFSRPPRPAPAPDTLPTAAPPIFRGRRCVVLPPGRLAPTRRRRGAGRGRQLVRRRRGRGRGGVRFCQRPGVEGGAWGAPRV